MNYKTIKYVSFLISMGLTIAMFWIFLPLDRHSSPLKMFHLTVVPAVVLIVPIILLRLIALQEKKNSLMQREIDKMIFRATDDRKESEILHALSHASFEFTEKQELRMVLDSITDTIRRILHVDISLVELITDKLDAPSMRLTKGAKNILVDDAIYNDVIVKGRSLLINDLTAYDRYFKLKEQGLRSILVSPLRIKNKIVGLMGVFSRATSEFIGGELELLGIFANQAALIIQNARLLETTKELSIIDELTQLFNFRYFKTHLTEEFYRADRYNHPLSLLIGDIDFFKNYNDTNGHNSGNKVLSKIAQIIKLSVRPSDVPARYGGEEFSILLLETPKQNAKIVAEKIRRQIENEHFENEEKQPNGNLTMTIGVAAFPDDATNPDELIEFADKALYTGKSSGKNQVKVYNVG